MLSGQLDGWEGLMTHTALWHPCLPSPCSAADDRDAVCKLKPGWSAWEVDNHKAGMKIFEVQVAKYSHSATSGMVCKTTASSLSREQRTYSASYSPGGCVALLSPCLPPTPALNWVAHSFLSFLLFPDKMGTNQLSSRFFDTTEGAAHRWLTY